MKVNGNQWIAEMVEIRHSNFFIVCTIVSSDVKCVWLLEHGLKHAKLLEYFKETCHSFSPACSRYFKNISQCFPTLHCIRNLQRGLKVKLFFFSFFFPHVKYYKSHFVWTTHAHINDATIDYFHHWLIFWVFSLGWSTHQEALKNVHKSQYPRAQDDIIKCLVFVWRQSNPPSPKL